MAYRIRRAVRADASFLVEMACEAANWNPARVRPKVELLADPTVMRSARGWMRPADAGVIAVDETGESIGACWFRVQPRERGPELVGAGVPELTLGVRPMWRAQGVGRALLVETCALARTAGHQRIALSVASANFAEKLYRSEGFVVVAGEPGRDGFDVMLKTLR